MKTMIVRSLVLTGVVSAFSLGLGATPARAQAFGFNYASPGFSFGVGAGGYGGYGAYGGYYGGYPMVAPAPVVVAPGPMVIAPRPLVVAPRPFYGGYYGGGYRPYYGRGYYRR